MSAYRKLFRYSGLALAVAVIALFGFVWSDGKDHAGFDPVAQECPIVWATYTYGTNHTIYIRKGRPMRPQRLGRILRWMDLAALKVTNRGIFEITPWSGSTPTPTLFVHVGLKHEVRSDSRPRLWAFLTEPTGQTRSCSGLTGLKAEWMFSFDGLTGAIHGCVVKFVSAEGMYIPGYGVDPVAKLKL